MEQFFEIVNIWMMPWWIIWLWSPGSKIAGWMARNPWPIFFPVLAYVFLIIPGLPKILPELANPKLGPIAGFLGEPTGAFAGWAHFLVMDYLVGAWMVSRFQNHSGGVNPWIIRGLLFATLMFGPIGASLSFFCLPVRQDGVEQK